MSRFVKLALLGTGALIALFAVYLLIGPDTPKTSRLKRLETEGLVASAKVIDTYVEEHVNYASSGSGPPRRSLGRVIRNINDFNHRADNATVTYFHFAEVEFKSAKGQTFRTKMNFPEQFHASIKTGALVSVLYHPEDPEGIRRLKDYSSPFPDMSHERNAFAFFMLGMAALLLLYGWTRPDAETKVDAEAIIANHMATAQAVRASASEATRRPARAAGMSHGFGRRARAARA